MGQELEDGKTLKIVEGNLFISRYSPNKSWTEVTNREKRRNPIWMPIFAFKFKTISEEDDSTLQDLGIEKDSSIFFSLHKGGWTKVLNID